MPRAERMRASGVATILRCCSACQGTHIRTASNNFSREHLRRRERHWGRPHESRTKAAASSGVIVGSAGDDVAHRRAPCTPTLDQTRAPAPAAAVERANDREKTVAIALVDHHGVAGGGLATVHPVSVQELAQAARGGRTDFDGIGKRPVFE
jgi:hypothetical protein